VRLKFCLHRALSHSRIYSGRREIDPAAARGAREGVLRALPLRGYRQLTLAVPHPLGLESSVPPARRLGDSTSRDLFSGAGFDVALRTRIGSSSGAQRFQREPKAGPHRRHQTQHCAPVRSTSSAVGRFTRRAKRAPSHSAARPPRGRWDGPSYVRGDSRVRRARAGGRCPPGEWRSLRLGASLPPPSCARPVDRRGTTPCVERALRRGVGCGSAPPHHLRPFPSPHSHAAPRTANRVQDVARLRPRLESLRGHLTWTPPGRDLTLAVLAFERSLGLDLSRSASKRRPVPRPYAARRSIHQRVT
jgi:hypothetical protein